MPPTLSARLATIASFVLPGRPMADVGTDHGHLPAALVARGTVPNAIASDALEGPLEAAAQTLYRSGTADLIELRLANGLRRLADAEVATIVIAGMGGRSIVDILDGGVPAGTQRLVLQPNTGVAHLRRHLDRTGWHIHDEAMVEEGERLYPIVVAEPGGECGSLSEPDLALGPVLRHVVSAPMQTWVSREQAKLERKLAGMARGSHPALDELERTRRLLQILNEYLASCL